METKTSKGKEIRIPGPDHPITISPAVGKVRVTVAGGKSLNRRAHFAWRRRDIRLFITCRATMPTCRCSFVPRITPIVRTRVIVPTTAFPSADRNRNMPFGHTKNRMRQSSVLRSTWRFIPHGLIQSRLSPKQVAGCSAGRHAQTRERTVMSSVNKSEGQKGINMPKTTPEQNKALAVVHSP